MRKEKTGSGYLSGILPLIAGVLGAAILFVVFHLGTYTCRKDAKERMDSVIRYIENQCTLYEDVAAEEETKSLIRMADKALEFQKTFDIHRASKDTSFILEYMDDQRLTGILITDESLATVASCVVEGETGQDWNSVLQKTSSVMDDPFKCYSERVLTPEGDYLDYAVMGRTDERGVILCYQRQSYEMIAGTRMSVGTLLSGYDFDSDGIIVVTDGVTVIGSNDATLGGMRADECELIRDVRNTSDFGELVHVDADDSSYYAMRGKCKSNYIYVLCPEQRVFMQRSVLFACAAAIYVLVMVIVFALHLRIDYVRRREHEKSREAYRVEMDRLAEDALRANEAKSDFLRRISHDIRTPVNGICGMLDIAEDCDDDPKRRRECYAKIRQASDYLLELVGGVLDMSKLEQNNFSWSEEPFDIEKEFDNVVTLSATSAQKEGISFCSEVGEIRHERVTGSAVLFKRICLNLIGNALKYTRKGGSVSISLSEEPPEKGAKKACYRFVCKDTGIGMSRDFQPHMFEPFSKEDSSFKPNYSGVGLGLSIVRSLLDAMGGSIEVESAKGVGTTFTVHFVFSVGEEEEEKAEKREDLSALTEQSPQGKDADLTGCRVLLAEDNELNTEIAVYFLKKAGAEVSSAGDGKEAVDLYLEKPAGSFDVILMDIMMPTMNGLEAAQAIRSSGRSDAADIPIIAMSANAYADDMDRAKQAGISDYLSKPLDACKMTAMIALYRRKRQP